MKVQKKTLFNSRATRTAFFLILFVLAKNGTSAEPDEMNLANNAFIYWDEVMAPFGRFLLVRKEKDACAIRFIGHHRGGDSMSPTLFNSGEESLYAEYEWFHQSDGSGNFVKSNVLSGHEKLVRKPLRGIGRMAFQTGDVNVKCGPFLQNWSYPESVSFSDPTASRLADSGIEMAPTAWTTIKEVDIHDSRLSWYRYDENRNKIYVPIAKLPQ